MNELNLPRWSAPIIGCVCGLILSFRVAPQTNDAAGLTVMVFALFGLLGGGLLMVLDRPVQETGVGEVEGESNDSTQLGKVLAIVGLLTSVIPVVGLLLSGAAWYLNRNIYRWPRMCATLGLIISVLWTIVALFIR